MDKRLGVYSVLFLVQLIFAFNYVMTKVIVGVIDPVWWALIRFSISAFLMTIFGIFLKNEVTTHSFKYYFRIAVLAFFGVALSQITFLKGIKLTTSINSAIICSTIPIFTLLILVIRGNEKLNPKNISGILLAFLGVVFIRNFEEFKITNETFVGDLLVLLNSLSSAIYIAYSRELLRDKKPWRLTAHVFFAGSVMILLWGIFENNPIFTKEITRSIAFSMVYVVLAATLLSYLLINWAISKVDSGKVSFFIYLQPPLTSAVAYLFLSEPITLRTILSSLLIVAGFILTLKPKKLEEGA